MTKSSLKELRKENGKSRAEVAAALSVSIQTIYKYEQGVRHISLEQVLILEDLYNCTAEEIVNAQLKSGTT